MKTILFILLAIVSLSSCKHIRAMIDEPNPKCKLAGKCYGHYGNNYCKGLPHPFNPAVDLK